MTGTRVSEQTGHSLDLSVWRVSVNGLAVTAQELMGRILSLLVTVILARHLGPGLFGEYSFALTYVALFGLVADLGVATIAVREISASREHESVLLGNAILVKLGLAGLGFALALAGAALPIYPSSTKWLLVLMSMTLFTFSTGGLGTIYVAVFSVRLARSYVTVVDFALRLSVFAVALGVIWMGGSLLHFVSLSVLLQLVSVAILARRAGQVIRPDYKFNWEVCKMLLRESFPIAVTSVFVTLYFRLDVVFLTWWKDITAVGFYSAAYRMAEALTTVGIVLSTTLLPVASATLVKDLARFRQLLRLSIRGIALVMIPICVVLSGYSDVVIRLVYSDKYGASVQALGILAWAPAFMVFGSLNYVVQVSTHRQWLLTRLTLVMLATNVALNVLLIPQFSFIGASLATVLTEFVGFLIVLYWLLRDHRYAFPLSLLGIIPTALMFQGVVWLSRGLPQLLGLAMCAVTYPALALLFRCLSFDDLRKLHALFVRLRLRQA